VGVNKLSTMTYPLINSQSEETIKLTDAMIPDRCKLIVYCNRLIISGRLNQLSTSTVPLIPDRCSLNKSKIGAYLERIITLNLKI